MPTRRTFSLWSARSKYHGQREAVEAPSGQALDAQFEADDGRANRKWQLQSVQSSLQGADKALGNLVAAFGAVVVEFVAVGLLGPPESAAKASLEVAAGDGVQRSPVLGRFESRGPAGQALFDQRVQPLNTLLALILADELAYVLDGVAVGISALGTDVVLGHGAILGVCVVRQGRRNTTSLAPCT